MDIVESTRAYEQWLREQLKGDVVVDDLDEKHEKMAENPFVFLRATYWRWAETIYQVCPALQGAPQVLAIGDIHLENFGVWRDTEGRLVWGVNDFDEAAEMPYVLDLVRLATSAALTDRAERPSRGKICASVLRGYRAGLRNPGAFVLDRGHDWLRDQFLVSAEDREAYWAKIDGNVEQAMQDRKTPNEPYRERLEGAMPEHDIPGRIKLQFWPSSAGTGSLGRPRWVAHGEWRGAAVLREVKAIVPSAWTRFEGRGGGPIRAGEAADGAFRSPDPFYWIRDRSVVRRLSPNSRKLEVKDVGSVSVLLAPRMLRCMGRELANVHLGTAADYSGLARAIRRDLKTRKRRWLAKSVKAAAKFIRDEYRQWSEL